MTKIYTVTLEDAYELQECLETCWDKCYASLPSAVTACLSDLAYFRREQEESVVIIPGFVKVEDKPIWILDDCEMSGKVWTIFETELTQGDGRELTALVREVPAHQEYR